MSVSMTIDDEIWNENIDVAQKVGVQKVFVSLEFSSEKFSYLSDPLGFRFSYLCSGVRIRKVFVRIFWVRKVFVSFDSDMVQTDDDRRPPATHTHTRTRQPAQCIQCNQYQYHQSSLGTNTNELNAEVVPICADTRQFRCMSRRSLPYHSIGALDKR
jgi:hypothetical protein